MPAYTGEFQYTDARGATQAQGPCQVTFDKETCIVTPPAGQPLAFDLGDVDGADAQDRDLRLVLFGGSTVTLRKFGPAFGRMSAELTAAWRDRTAECLLLEDLEEAGRFNGWAAADGGTASPAEIRICRSNVAVLPAGGAAVQRRLADIDRVNFDPATWTVTLESPQGKLAFSKLAKKTDEFRNTLGAALDALRTQCAEALDRQLPFLGADRLQRLLAAMPEGRSAPLAALAAIHPKLPEAMVTGAVDARVRPYLDALSKRSGGRPLAAGFKLIRENEEPDPDREAEAAAGAEEAPALETSAPDSAGDQERRPLFFWFFFQLAGRPDTVAWEAAAGSGRATYFFRVANPATAGDSVEALTRGLALVNFRREPVYLPDDALVEQQRYRRYAIGCRKLPELRRLREAYLGRAIHSSLEKWAAQVDSISRMTPHG